MSDTDDISQIATDIAETAIERAETTGFESTATVDDLAEFARDIETWLRSHMQPVR